MGIHITITHDPIERPPDNDDLALKNIGAVAEFLGIVRDSEDGKPIAALEYESFREMAEHQLYILAEKYSALYRISDLLCIHRIGKIPAGETSLFIRITSSHRAEAFTAMSEFINDLKKIVPIWKHPVYT